jgi:hypothetical protein
MSNPVLDYFSGSRSETLSEASLDAFQDLLNKTRNLPEPDYRSLIQESFAGFTGSNISPAQQESYERFFKAAGVKSPGEISSYVTQDLAMRPENYGYLPLNETAEKMAAYYGAPNVKDGKFTGTYGRGFDRLEGRPNYA